MDTRRERMIQWAMPSLQSPSRLRAQAAILLFFTLNFAYLAISSGRVRTIDEVSVDFLTESLITKGTSSVPQAVNANLFYGKLDRQGRPQTPYGMGQALLIAPWYAAGKLASERLPGIPVNAKNLVQDAVLVASNATFAALAVTLLFLLLSALGVSLRNSLLAALLLGFATPLLAYSTWLFSEPIAVFLLMAAALALFSVQSGQITFARTVLAGAALGVALWVRPTHVIAAPVFLFALMMQDRRNGWRAALQTGMIVGLFGGLYLLRNELFFGNPFDFGYPAAAEGGKLVISFHTPLFTGLYGFLLSPGKSVFLFAPPVLLALLGIKNLAKRSKGLAFVAIVTPLVYLFFFARYTQWEGGFCVGPRYLVPAISLLCLAVGPLLEDKANWTRIATLVLVAGFLIQIPGIATSFLEDQARGRYYDQKFNYRMEYAPLISQTKLFAHYATSSVPAPLGLGFDRWFVFLGKAGVSKPLLYSVLLFQIAGTIGFALLIKKSKEPERAT